jgi:transposase
MAGQRDDNIKSSRAAMNNSPEQQGDSWLEKRGFGGLDWASQKHYVVVVDPKGKVLEDFELEHSSLGWKKFREVMQPYGRIPFAIETSQGFVVEQLLEAGMEVYPLNPQSAQAYRQRKAPSGVKDDRLDGWSFADALRVDGQNWKPLRPESALIKELRLLCRDEVGLIEERTALVNKLRHALAEYYPIALEAFEDWICLSAWMFLQRFPTPQVLEKAGKREWEKFLHSRHLWRNESGPRRMELFAKATEFCGSQGTTNAKSMLALGLVKRLFVLETQLSDYRKRIEELFHSHPDHDLFGSLPGAGPKIAPRLLSEIGDDRDRFQGDVQNLQCLAGTGPVTKRSGKHWECHQRWACSKPLRHVLHLFSEHTITQCAWAEIYYRTHRAKDQSHAGALRCLAHRWLKIIYKMWLERTPYDPELHHRNQLKHGSWVFELKTVNCK